MKLSPSKSLHSYPGHFAAEIGKGQLEISAEVVDSLSRLSVRTAEDLMSYLAAFPTSVAKALGWTIEEVDEARQSLVETLRGRVPSEILEPSFNFDRPLGAFDPSDLRLKKTLP